MGKAKSATKFISDGGSIRKAKCEEGKMISKVPHRRCGVDSHPISHDESAGKTDMHTADCRSYGMFSEGASSEPYIKAIKRGESPMSKDLNTAVVAEKQDGDDDDDVYSPSDILCDLLEAEVSTYVESLQRDRRCMLCPFRAFQAPNRVRNHISKYHVASNIWCASGRKQLRVCIALYNNDSFITPPGDQFDPQPYYLRRSAEIMRDQILTNSPGMEDELAASNSIDREIRLIQNAEGPEFRHVDFMRREGHRFRSMGYNFYAESFYNEVCRNAVQEQGRVGQIMANMQNECENELGCLQPKYIHVWEAILFDIFYSEGIEDRISRILNICLIHGEFESITVDCTVKPTIPLLGQVNHNVKKTRRRHRLSHMPSSITQSLLCADRAAPPF